MVLSHANVPVPDREGDRLNAEATDAVFIGWLNLIMILELVGTETADDVGLAFNTEGLNPGRIE